jgi:hypothetical protein
MFQTNVRKSQKTDILKICPRVEPNFWKIEPNFEKSTEFLLKKLTEPNFGRKSNRIFGKMIKIRLYLTFYDYKSREQPSIQQNHHFQQD